MFKGNSGNFFGNNKNTVHQKLTLESSYKGARMNLLIVIVLTVVNLFMLVFGNGSYFLASLALPYNIAINAMFLCGKFPPDFYQGDLALPTFLDDSYFVLMMAIVVAILAVYLLCFFMSSRRRVGWLIASLVLFGLDTAAMFFIYGLASEMIIDYVIHAVFIYFIAMGVYYEFKLRKLEAEEAAMPKQATDPAENPDDVSHFFENN